MTESTTYRIVTLPKHQDEQTTLALASKFKELRLHALQTSPDAFGSNYETESQKSIEQSLERLRNPKAVHFIAKRRSPTDSPFFDGNNDVERILKSEWVGFIVLLGPQEGDGAGHPGGGDPFAKMTAVGETSSNSLDSSSELHYHLSGMFVDPSARRGGLGKALIDAALAKAEADAAKTNAALRFTIAVYAHNIGARKLYERAGFKTTSERPSQTYDDRIAVEMEMYLAADP